MYLYVHLAPNANPAVVENEFRIQARGAAFGHRQSGKYNDAGRLIMAGYEREATGATVQPFATGADMLSVIAQYNNIEKFIVFAHGAPQWIGWQGRGGIHVRREGNSFRSVAQLAQVLSPKLTENAIIGLAACSCGMGQAEWRQFFQREGGNYVLQGQSYDVQRVERQYMEGATDSFAALLRDALVDAGSSSFEIRAHKIRGGTTANPNCVYFRPGRGTPGNIVAVDVLGPPDGNDARTLGQFRRDWNSQFLGLEANNWIIGGAGQSALPDISESAGESGGSPSSRVQASRTGIGGRYLYANANTSTLGGSSIDTIPIMNRDEIARALQESAKQLEDTFNDSDAGRR